MIDLEKTSGLPIALDPERMRIVFLDSDVRAERETNRTLAEMVEFIAEPDGRATRDPIYVVYRSVARAAHRARFIQAGLRYDITVIPPGVFSGARRECFRTAGHYHPLRPDGRTAYPEVYEVLFGRAYWLVQRRDADDPEALAECYTIEAGPGERAIMLPGFGHISVNAFDAPLVMSNWIGDAFGYDYEPYRRHRGGGYRMLDANGLIEFEANTSYRRVPDIRKLKPRPLPAFGLVAGRPMYELTADLERLKFLTEPERYGQLLTLENCFEISTE